MSARFETPGIVKSNHYRTYSNWFLATNPLFYSSKDESSLSIGRVYSKEKTPLPTIVYSIIESSYLCFRLNDTAKEIIRESLPIKCLEAVILAMYPLYTVIVFQLMNPKTIEFFAYT